MRWQRRKQPARGDLAALDDALKALAGMDERKARVIELGFFGGLSVEETADPSSRCRSIP